MSKLKRPTMQLEVLKPMRYNTRRLLPGETFEAEVKHGKAFMLLKKAKPYRSPEMLEQIPQKLVERVTAPVALYGSSLLEAVYQIGGESVQLGTIVKNAHASSGLTVDQWNLLQADTREALLADELKRLKTEAGEGDGPADETEVPVDEKGEGSEGGEGGESEEDKPDETPELTEAEILAAARAEYKEVVGRAAYGGWDAAKIRENINAFKAKQS